MKSFLRTTAISFAALALCAPAALGGQEASTPRPQAPGSDYVDTKGFTSKIIEVRHRDPLSLARVLAPLGSGFKGAAILPNPDFHTISVRDWPENVATIEEAVRRLDVPEAPRADVELHLHVLLASAGGTSGDLPPEIRPAVGQLQSAFNYKSFTLLTPIVQRTREGDWNTEGNGQVSQPTGSLAYAYSIRSVSRSTDADGVPHVQLNGFTFNLNGYDKTGQAHVQSNLSLRDGEQIVVGTASLLGGQALVLILSARVAK